jgi:DNA-binding IclR family transcriptional regulator
MANATTHSVPSVERALAILEVLAASKGGLTLAELTRRLGLARSSTHCLLLTLERCGYLLRNNSTHRYVFGLKVFSLANLALSRIALREQAGPFLHELMETSRLTVHMAVLDRGEAVIVEKVEPPGLLRLASWVGKRFDLHCTGVGKALLAHLPESEFDRVLKLGLARHNENTVASVKKLREQIAHIRRVGYSLEDEEGEIGFRCIGAPIFDHTSNVAAAISVAGTTAQIDPGKFRPLAERVKETASRISQSLGFVPNDPKTA